MNPTNLSTTNGLEQSPVRAATQAARHVGDVASQEAGHVGEALHDWWAHQKDDARHTLDAVRHRALAAGERTRDVVRERPVVSLLGAAAIGMVLGGVLLWLSGRSHRNY